MSNLNIPFPDKMRIISTKVFVFLTYRKNILRTRISHRKRVIGVRGFEVLLYMDISQYAVLV